jgi:hypothetical protein
MRVISLLYRDGSDASGGTNADTCSGPLSMFTGANRCKFDGTNIGTTQKPSAATPNPANVYAIRAAHWKCGARQGA